MTYEYDHLFSINKCIYCFLKFFYSPTYLKIRSRAYTVQFALADNRSYKGSTLIREGPLHTPHVAPVPCHSHVTFLDNFKNIIELKLKIL